jgi:TatA/E family protein of Tat protein translocase
MGFGSLGISELVVIFLIVLVAFGPRRFPEIARSMGSAMREFRRSLNQIQRELEEVDPRKDLPGKDILNDIRSGKPGNWLDPNKTRVPAATSGGRSAPETPGPEVTGEAVAATAAVTSAGPTPTAPNASGGADPDVEQLPMFSRPAGVPMSEEEVNEPSVSESAEPETEPDSGDPLTEDSRSD